MSEKWTFFYSEDGKQLVEKAEGILSIPLRQGMVMTIHGYPGKEFEVIDWNYHHGHPDEDPGLRIILRVKGELAGVGFA